MARLQELVRTIRSAVRNVEALDDVSESVAALSADVADVELRLRRMTEDLALSRQRTAEQLSLAAAEAVDRAALAAIPQARLRSDLLFLEGGAAERLHVRRRSVGDTVERPFSRWMGTTQSVTQDPAIQMLWHRLLAFEKACADVLRGGPNTVLDVPGGTVSRAEPRGLRIQLRGQHRPSDQRPMTPAPLAIPRFTYDFPGGKLDNFGHWLVDCLPHVLALTTIVPQATLLLPAPVKRFQRALLSLIGVTDAQMLPWNGEPIESSRLLVLESDGRLGGGRPLSSLRHLRSLVSAPGGVPPERRTQRIYVSRRDAAGKRAWVANEADIEALFRSRGFDVLVMAECPLEEQVRLFRSAAVVAGVSGAGLADIVFSPPGTHVMVLLTDSLIRWYAKPGRGRAKWASDAGAKETNLAAFGDSPRFYAHLAAACEQCCHSFLSADHVPLDALASFVDDVLAQEERRRGVPGDPEERRRGVPGDGTAPP